MKVRAVAERARGRRNSVLATLLPKGCVNPRPRQSRRLRELPYAGPWLLVLAENKTTAVRFLLEWRSVREAGNQQPSKEPKGQLWRKAEKNEAGQRDWSRVHLEWSGVEWSGVGGTRGGTAPSSEEARGLCAASWHGVFRPQRAAPFIPRWEQQSRQGDWDGVRLDRETS